MRAKRATRDAAACACAVSTRRKAAGVDPRIKAANRNRLRRIEGQIRGIARRVLGTFVEPNIARHLDYMEGELRERPWFAGSEFSAADIQMSFPLEAAAARGGSRPALGQAGRLGVACVHAERRDRAVAHGRVESQRLRLAGAGLERDLDEPASASALLERLQQPAAQPRPAGSVSAKSPIDPVSVASEFRSSRIFANVRSSSLISSRSGCRLRS